VSTERHVWIIARTFRATSVLTRRIPVEIYDEVVQRRIQPAAQSMELSEFLLGNVPFQLRASKAVAQFVQRPARDFKIAGELGMRWTAESFCDVAANGLDRIFSLRAGLEVGEERSSSREPEDDDPDGIRELPGNEL